MGAIKRALLRIALVAACVAALIAIVAILTGRLDRTEGRILLTHMIVLVYTLFGLMASTVVSRNPRLALAGWLVSGVGAGLALIATWSEWSRDWEGLFRWTWIFFVAAFTLGHICLIVSRRRDVDGAAVRVISSATVAAVVTLGTIVGLAIAKVPASGPPSWYWRLLGVVGVLDVLGTVTLPIARKIERSASSG